MNWMNFQGPGFVMEVPTDWFVMSSPQFQAMFLAPPATDAVRANLVISVRPLKEGVTSQAVAVAARETQEKEYPDYQVIEEIGFDQEDSRAVQRLYSWINPEKNVPIVQLQTFYVVDQMLYTLTATREEQAEHADDLDETFSHMVSTFTVSGKEA